MLTKRIIPCLDVHAGRVVKGTKFLDLRDAGDPVECAMAYNDQGADEIVFFDITAILGRARDHDRRGRAHGRTLLHAADRRRRHPHRGRHARHAARRRGQGQHQHRRDVRSRVSIGDAASAFGSQCIVVAIDAKRNARRLMEGLHPRRPQCARRRNSTRSSGPREVAGAGAGEIVLTSMDADGTKAGYDLALHEARQRGRRRSRSSPAAARATSITWCMCCTRAKPMPCSRPAFSTSGNSPSAM